MVIENPSTAVIRSGRLSSNLEGPRVRPISQVLLTCSSEATDAGHVADEIRRVVLRWIRGKAGRSLPQPAWDGDPFNLAHVGAQRAEATRVDGYWSARADDQDKTVARRTWVTDVTLATESDRVLFGTRLFAVTHGEDVPMSRSLPYLVRDVVNSVDCYIDGRKIESQRIGHRINIQPWVINSESEVESLVSFLTDPSRKLPVCVFSLPEWSTSPNDTALNTEPVLNGTVGVAHVAMLTGPASHLLTESIGREWSVFRSAVRTYWPKIDLDTSDPFQHLLTTLPKMEGWEGGPDGFGKVLIESLLRSTVSYRYVEDVLPTYARVRQMRREQVRQVELEGDISEHERLEQARQDYDDLQQQFEEEKDELYGFVSDAENERNQLKGQLADAREQIKSLNARIYHLRSSQSGNDTSMTEETEIPADLESLEGWSKNHLGGTVFLHNRAIRAARKSRFENVPLAYKALILLRDYYAPMKHEGGIDARRAYDDALHQLGLEDSEPFTGTRAAQVGDSYFVEFGGKKRYLERHLKGSNSRDERYGFRLYFFWDDDTDQVVVGSLPSHLPHPSLS